MMTRAVPIVLPMVLLCGCVAMNDSWTASEVVNGETQLGPGYLRKDQTIEVEGEFDGGRLLAKRIEIEEPDDELEVKSEIEVVESGAVRLGGVEFRVADDTRFLDAEGRELGRDAFARAVGVWAKAEGVERDGELQLRKVTLRSRLDDELEELQGVIEAVDLSRRMLRVGPVEVALGAGVPIVWDVSDQEPPALDERGFVTRRAGGARRVRRVDVDDRRPDDQLVIDDFLTIGGEVQYDGEWRKNHDLRRDRRRDRMIHGASTKLELSFDFSDEVFAFMKHRLGHDILIFDERERLESGHLEYRLEEAYVLLTDVPAPGFGLQIGRQDFDHGREWVMDTEIDGVRAWVLTTAGMLQFSISKALGDASREEDGIVNFMAGAQIDTIEELQVFAYYLHRRGGDLVDLDRHHVGASMEAEIAGFTLWLDVGLVAGEEDDTNLFGWGLDFMSMYVFEDVVLEPSLIAGVAFGSGDDGRGGTDHSFRQTGLQDNNDRFNGVTSFRYLGELLRPELSNIIVLTLGAGIRHGNTSFDAVFHEYRQVEPSTTLRDTRLRLNPNGNSRDLGRGVDFILGLEQWRPLEIEVVLGLFFPGNAFPTETGAAWYFTFQTELNF